jgi:potassium channel LctB
MKNVKKEQVEQPRIEAQETRLEKHVSLFKRFFNLTLNHFFITFIILYLAMTISLMLDQGLISILFGVMLVIYVITFLVNRINYNIRKFLHHELGIKQISIAYITSVLFIIILFSILYWLMTSTGAGYLRYGTCIDNVEFDRTSIINDTNSVTNIFHYSYFSAITFFTVGYGDICPMGMSKIISMLNALVGSMFNVLILAIAIVNYSNTKNEEKRKKID